MSTFTASLFRLLNAADTVVISGYLIENIQDCGASAAGKPVMRCEVGDDDHEWHFEDQSVVVCDGVCTATTAVGDWPDNDSDDVTLEFRVERMLEASDLPPVAQP